MMCWSHKYVHIFVSVEGSEGYIKGDEMSVGTIFGVVGFVILLIVAWVTK